MSSILVVVFGTNQNFENPRQLFLKYIETHNAENVVCKRESSVEFSRQLTQSDPTKVKLIFLRNLEKQYAICKQADANVIFVDLENVDALDKLNNIIEYINESCNEDVMNYVVGKYDSDEDKIQSLNESSMNFKLKEKLIKYIYKDICTQPNNAFDDYIESVLQKIQNDKLRKIKNDKINKFNDNESQSNCFIY